jgi:hypothetical protein
MIFSILASVDHPIAGAAWRNAVSVTVNRFTGGAPDKPNDD